jgi:hypothetical protein
MLIPALRRTSNNADKSTTSTARWAFLAGGTPTYWLSFPDGPASPNVVIVHDHSSPDDAGPERSASQLELPVKLAAARMLPLGCRSLIGA